MYQLCEHGKQDGEPCEECAATVSAQFAQADGSAEMERRVALWDAINRYVTACGGDPAKRVYGNTARQVAVGEVEDIVFRQND